MNCVYWLTLTLQSHAICGTKPCNSRLTSQEFTRGSVRFEDARGRVTRMGNLPTMAYMVLMGDPQICNLP